MVPQPLWEKRRIRHLTQPSIDRERSPNTKLTLRERIIIAQDFVAIRIAVTPRLRLGGRAPRAIRQSRLPTAPRGLER